MKTRINITFLILLITLTCSYSQITIKNIQKNDTVVLKPEPYDSLKQFTRQDRNLDYKQYIGLQFYLPPFSNPIIGQRQNTNIVSFFYATKPNTIKIDTNYFNKNADKYTVYNKIYTYKYKPFHYYTGGALVSVSNSEIVANKYYTLLNVLYGDTLFSLWEQMSNNIWELDSLVTHNKNQFTIYHYYNVNRKKKDKNWYNWYNSDSRILTDYIGFRKNESKPSLVFVFKDDKNGDTLYCTNPWRLILVPYFVKQKQTYEGKKLICNGYFQTTDLVNGKFVNVVNHSKWSCEEVTFLKSDEIDPKYLQRYGRQTRSNPYGGQTNTEYLLTYILKKDSGTTIAITGLGVEKDDYMRGHYFLEENIFNIKEKEKKLQNDELIAKQKQEKESRIKKEKEAAEKYRKECINKYVQYYGELIAQDKVAIGMTQEMCKTAWGKPYLTNKTSTEYGVYENWYYGYGYSLHFVDGILKIIKE